MLRLHAGADPPACDRSWMLIPGNVIDVGFMQSNDRHLEEAMQRGTAAEQKQAMKALMLGLVLAAAVAVVFLMLRLRRRPTEAFPLTVVDTPHGTRKPIVEVDLLLDLPDVAIEESARLGYVDSTMPAVQDPAPFGSAGRI